MLMSSCLLVWRSFAVLRDFKPYMIIFMNVCVFITVAIV
jgi:hypothetical protein